MLAMHYLTADRLRVTERCRTALIQTLRKLEYGEIAARDFNMESLKQCFYGHAQRIDPGSMPAIEHLCGGLMNLCFPFDCTIAFTATRSQGAHALRNFLVTGRASWPVVMCMPHDPNCAAEWKLQVTKDAIYVVPVRQPEAALAA